MSPAPRTEPGPGSARSALISVVTTGHDVADARLHREVAALRRDGLRVEVLGLGDPAGAPASTEVRTWPRAGGVRRAWRAVTMPWRAKGRVLLALDPDSAVGARVRRALGRLPGVRRVRVVADVHEDYRLLLRDRSWARGVRGLAGRVWAGMGERAARGADLTVVADEHLLPDAPNRVVLRNLPDPTMLPGPSEPAPTPRALYVGDLRRSRGLFTMLDAVEAAPGWELDLVGPIAAVDRQAALTRIASAGLSGRVRWHDRMPPREAWRHATGAWAGLLLLDDTPAFRGAVPSKLYEYLACGLPVVATGLPRVARLLTETGAGVVVTDAEAASAVLRGWRDDPGLFQMVRRAAGSAPTYPDDGPAFVAGCRSLVDEGISGGPESTKGPRKNTP